MKCDHAATRYLKCDVHGPTCTVIVCATCGRIQPTPTETEPTP